MNRESQSDAEPTIIFYRSLWLAMCSSVFLFGISLWTTFPRNPDSWFPAETEGVREILTRTPGIFFSGAAILVLLFSRILPSFFKNNLLPKASDQGESVRQKQALFVFVMRFALLESIAILGFVLAFLERNFQVYLVFAVVALLNMLIRFPRALAKS